MMSEPVVMWLCCTGQHPVGLVKRYDDIEGRWKYYIGTGNGVDQDEDIQLILDWGQKFYDLQFIADFAENEPECEACEIHYSTEVDDG